MMHPIAQMHQMRKRRAESYVRMVAHAEDRVMDAWLLALFGHLTVRDITFAEFRLDIYLIYPEERKR